MNSPKETTFRFSQNYYKTSLYFLGISDFEAMNKEDKTLNGKFTENINEKVPVTVTFYIQVNEVSILL